MFMYQSDYYYRMLKFHCRDNNYIKHSYRVGIPTGYGRYLLTISTILLLM